MERPKERESEEERDEKSGRERIKRAKERQKDIKIK